MEAKSFQDKGDIPLGRLEGKVAIVTGAAHGLGASHALALAREGADVAAVDIYRDLPYPEYPLGTGDELNSVVTEIQALGRRAIAIKCDTSIAGREGQAGNSPYCAAKAGIVTFSHAIAKEVAPHNINVNCVGPGMVMTPMVRGVLESIAEGMGISVVQVYAGAWGMYQILAREILPEDVSNAVVFLASEEARNINGQVIYVDGGHVAI